MPTNLAQIPVAKQDVLQMASADIVEKRLDVTTHNRSLISMCLSPGHDASTYHEAVSRGASPIPIENVFQHIGLNGFEFVAGHGQCPEFPILLGNPGKRHVAVHILDHSVDFVNTTSE